ncbi:helix-turn-helix domain-containing protein [Adlercreutzia equolifaciens]|uniref:helix-turn-helix domain-containing protein n=1 Tax=Adlercreutzia equolifaciens TaxID=446660 RepID=UPI0023B18560|nr:helix-turn-helix domain-containing protein [Adlercreutzia equolifaciens]MDE8701875.1 helix-turn-helix domain-containing protein [Adlercreutzia equolifaciens]
MIQLAENVRALRLARRQTQEEVAQALGITPQSVSKWERGEGLPDITLLPALAAHFSVSTDEILGCAPPSRTRDYATINETWRLQNDAGLNAENVELMHSALEQFPNDALLLVQLSTSLEKAGSTAEERANNLRESLEVQERILRLPVDSEVRSATLFNICFTYWKLGRKTLALDCARQLPNLYKARENALVTFLEGEERRAVALEALEAVIWVASRHLNALADLEEDERYREKARAVEEILKDAVRQGSVESQS